MEYFNNRTIDNHILQNICHEMENFYNYYCEMIKKNKKKSGKQVLAYEDIVNRPEQHSSFGSPSCPIAL